MGDTHTARWQQVRERMKAIEREMGDRPQTDDAFDHQAWLVAEHDALRAERDRLIEIESVNGEVDY